MVLLLIFFFVIVLLCEIPELIKNKYWHELKIFSIFLTIAFVISLFYIKELPVPNPTKWVEYIVKDILHLNYK